MSAPFCYPLHGLDGPFLDPSPHPRRLPAALVRAGSPQERWARAFLPPERVLCFTHPRSLAELTTTEILSESDAAALVRERGGGALLLSSATSRGIRDAALRHGLALLAVPYRLQRALEDKRVFHRLLVRAGLPVPAGETFIAAAGAAPRLHGRVVLQEPDSLGGEGTFFLDAGDAAGQVRALLDGGLLQAGRRYLVRRFVPGRPLGITVFVDARRVALSALRLQCYRPRQPGELRAAFTGVQWLPSAALGARLRARCDQIFHDLGRLLQRCGFRGFANVDFLVDESDGVHVLECNPRMSAATPQLLARPELAGGLRLGPLFLAALAGEEGDDAAPAFSPLPDSSYAGATLDLAPPADGRVTLDLPCGAYRVDHEGREGAERALRPVAAAPDAWGAGAPLLLSLLATPGERVGRDATLGTVLSDLPLYDDQGALNATGRWLAQALSPDTGDSVRGEPVEPPRALGQAQGKGDPRHA